MRFLLELTLGIIGVLLILTSLLLAFAGGLWDALAPALGDAISGPELADRAPSGAFLLGVPVGVLLLGLAWRVARSDRSERRAMESET